MTSVLTEYRNSSITTMKRQILIIYLLSLVFGTDAWLGGGPILKIDHATRRKKNLRNSNISFGNKYQKHQTLVLFALENNSEPTSSSSSSILSDIEDKIIYQRAFYSFTPGSDVTIHKSIVIEERVRFQADPNRKGYIRPIGPRTLVLRDGNVNDGEIGDDFFSINVDATTTIKQPQHHNGIGSDQTIEATIATALYLASNPNLCIGQVLQIACENGLAGLLGCIGAAYVNGDFQKQQLHSNGQDVSDDDVLTISKKRDPIIPAEMDMLTLTDDDVNNLEVVMKYCNQAGMKRNAIVEQLEWRTRPPVRPRGGIEFSKDRKIREYNTIIVSDVAYTYPESRELARTAANRLMALRMYDGTKQDSTNSRTLIPQLVHVCPEYRSEVTYLRSFLEKGYKMSVQTGYLKLEQLKFGYQKLTIDDATSGNETVLLDEMELELIDVKEKQYQCLLAQHHPQYAGLGSGELFFPLETGEYDATSGSTFLERDTGSSPW